LQLFLFLRLLQSWEKLGYDRDVLMQVNIEKSVINGRNSKGVGSDA